MTYHLAGDSTVADMKPGEYPMSGWGYALGRFVDAPVRNLAIGGSTTADFIDGGTWDELLTEVVPGDTVLLDFGHNDQKRPDVMGSRAGYTDRLRRMVRDVHALGATAVLCTSTERRCFDGDHVEPSHGDYPNAVRDLAEDLRVPLIDLTVFTSWLYEDLGDAGSYALLSHYAPGEYPGWPDGHDDDTHFTLEGATKIAAFVARSLRAIERRDGERPAKGTRLV